MDGPSGIFESWALCKLKCTSQYTETIQTLSLGSDILVFLNYKHVLSSSKLNYLCFGIIKHMVYNLYIIVMYVFQFYLRM